MGNWDDGSPLGRSQATIEKSILDRLVPFDPKRFGAKGDGVTDDSAAFIACRDAYLASATVNAQGARTLRGRMTIPAGKYLITQPAALFDQGALSSAQTYGYHVTGADRSGTEIIFTPAAPGALCINPNMFLNTTFENVCFTGSNADAVFLSSISQGGFAQNYTFRNCMWLGTWNEGIQLGGNVNAGNNSEIVWDKCGIHGAYTGAFFHCGSGGAFQSQDQFVNFDFNACEIELYSGTFLRADYGGSIRVRGGSMIMINSGTLFDLRTGVHFGGIANLLVEGQRIELRNSNCKLIYSEWKAGVVQFVGCDMEPIAGVNWTTATFYGSNDSGVLVSWNGCKLMGHHEYQFDGNMWSAVGSKAIYRDCIIGQYDDLQDLIVSTALASTTSLGGAWLIEFAGCKGKNNYGTNGADHAHDVVMNWQQRKNAEVTRRSRSLKTRGGTLPSSSGGWGTTIDVWMPLRSIVTDVHCSRPAGGADAATAWSYTLQTTEATPTVLATIAPGTAYNLGWRVHVHDVWWLADVDAKRHLQLIAAGIASFDTLGLYVIDYLPGS